jgi:transcriptional regulator with GAF, ATPase, and Fis domain
LVAQASLARCTDKRSPRNDGLLRHAKLGHVLSGREKAVLSVQEDMKDLDFKSISSPLHEKLLGHSPQIVEVNTLIHRLAEANLSVLITGETGSGKDIAARLLHNLSSRYGKPLIKVNCPSIPEGILESELFGYERGAFTGAHTAKPGRFELAHEGTIFLDEISETSPTVQSKLLQVLDGEPFLRIGGTNAVFTNARIVTATNIPLDQAIAQNKLREDIAFRLSEVVIQLPPLRERREDIPLLSEHFNYNMCSMLKREYRPLNPGLLEQLQQLEWTGNVRELAARIKIYVTTGDEESLLNSEPARAILAPTFETQNPRPFNVSTSVPIASPGTQDTDVQEERQFMSLREASRQAAEAAERALIEETLRYTLWNRKKAAKLLDTSYSSLLRRIETYNIGN